MTTILVIEDAPDILEDIEDTLRYEGFDILTAKNGMKGIEIAIKEIPDLIITDIMMPEADGYDVLKTLRGQIETAGIPIIFVTAKSSREDLRRGMALGSDDYLTKPFTTDELLSAVHTRLQRQAQLHEISELQFADVKKQFAHTIAHELRTPITGMTMAQDLLMHQGEHFSQQELREIIETMASSNRRMTNLVEQVTYFVHLETGLLDQESAMRRGQKIPFWSIMVGIADHARRYTPRAQDVAIQMNENNKETIVVGNLPALKHAFCELISNALKFSASGNQIVITYKRKRDHMIVTIDDYGAGMSEDQISTAMLPFQQIDRERQEQQGTGLGLWLASEIIKVHGGDLRIASVIGKGTRVGVRLPVTQE